MSDETKGNSSAQPPDGSAKPPDKPVKAEEQLAPGKAGDVQQGKDEAAVKPAPVAPAAKPGADAVKASTPPAAKPATPAAAKPAAPAKPAGPVPEPWDSELVVNLRRQYGSGIEEASTYVGQKYLVVDRTIAYEVLQVLRDEEQFDYLVDATAVHYPKRDKQFDIVWVLYSFPKNERIRVKTRIVETEPAPSVVAIWPTANWLERECYDMFGIQFEGHPDLRRILLPDGWKGHPLRKEYGIIQQDTDWVKANLGIESGQ